MTSYEEIKTSSLSLTEAERYALAQEIWQSIPSDSNIYSLTPEQEEELLRRQQLAEAGRMQYHSWEDVKKELFSS